MRCALLGAVGAVAVSVFGSRAVAYQEVPMSFVISGTGTVMDGQTLPYFAYSYDGTHWNVQGDGLLDTPDGHHWDAAVIGGPDFFDPPGGTEVYITEFAADNSFLGNRFDQTFGGNPAFDPATNSVAWPSDFLLPEPSSLLAAGLPLCLLCLRSRITPTC